MQRTGRPTVENVRFIRNKIMNGGCRRPNRVTLHNQRMKLAIDHCSAGTVK